MAVSWANGSRWHGGSSAHPSSAWARNVGFGQAPLVRPRGSIDHAGDRVCFGRALAGFSAADQATIRAQLKTYRYGRDLKHVLSDESRTRAFYQDGVAVIRSLDAQSDEPGVSRRGICQDLAQHCLHHLQTELGDRYTFQLVYGNAPAYFQKQLDTHVFLLGWPKSADERVEKALRENRFLIPPDAAVIDPSFGVFSDYKSAGLYRLNGVAPSGQAPARSGSGDTYSVTRLKVLEGQPEPLGYLQDLDPSVPIVPGERPMVFMLLCLDRQHQPVVRLMRMDTGDGPLYQWKTWQQETRTDSDLQRFVRKLETDMRESPPPGLFKALKASSGLQPGMHWLSKPRSPG